MNKDKITISETLESGQQTGDLVVQANDRVPTTTIVKGTEKQLDQLTNMYLEHASKVKGCKIVKPLKAKVTAKGKKAKLKETLDAQAAFVTPSKADINVVFHTEFGNLVLSVTDVLREEYSVCLVFKTAKDMRFSPVPGSNMRLSINGENPVNVYFPGSIFDYEGKKLMILFYVKPAKSE